MMSRLFFALDISTRDKIKLCEWRDQQLNLPFKAIHWANFHITLAFLGSTTDNQKQALLKDADAILLQLKHRELIKAALFLQLDYYDVFIKPKVLFLANNFNPPWLLFLAQQLTLSASKQGLFQEKRQYCAHVSLYRKAKIHTQYRLKDSLTKNIPLEINSFSLYQSVSTKLGVSYNPIKTWALTK